MNTLQEEFNNISLMPMMELELDNGDFEVYHIQATNEGLEAGGVTNTGFSSYGISVEWDDCFSLDEHLQALHEEILEYIQRQEEI